MSKLVPLVVVKDGQRAVVGDSEVDDNGPDEVIMHFDEIMAKMRKWGLEE